MIEYEKHTLQAPGGSSRSEFDNMYIIYIVNIYYNIIIIYIYIRKKATIQSINYELDNIVTPIIM